jgi:predicted Holliday junction resolvase-like endonuclease
VPSFKWELNLSTILTIISMLVVVSVLYGGKDVRLQQLELRERDLSIMMLKIQDSLADNTRALIRLEERLKASEEFERRKSFTTP